MELERERRGDSSVKKALQRYRTLVDQLRKENPEDPVGPLMDAWVMFREGRKEEAGWILRKYEKTRLYQQKQVTVRAVMLGEIVCHSFRNFIRNSRRTGSWCSCCWKKIQNFSRIPAWLINCWNGSFVGA